MSDLPSPENEFFNAKGSLLGIEDFEFELLFHKIIEDENLLNQLKDIIVQAKLAYSDSIQETITKHLDYKSREEMMWKIQLDAMKKQIERMNEKYG